MGIGQDAAIGNVILRGSEAAGEMGTGPQPGQPPSSPWDIWTHTGEGLASHQNGTAGQSPVPASRDPAMTAAANTLAHSSAGQTLDSMGAQAGGLGERLDELKQADGTLATVGATFALLTSAEQMLSSALSAIPFPAFPAVRIMDFDVGLPHAHAHPPNAPPAPPLPLPSTGPVIPIPFLSGAATVLINGMPAARCGDMGLAVWCGGYFPMYEIFLGSSSVWIESARAARLAVDITKHCIFTTPKPSDPPLGPMIGFTISASPNVLIGGVPMPSLSAIAIGKAAKGIGKLVGKGLKLGAKGWSKAVNRLSRNGCLGTRIANKLALKPGGLPARVTRALFGEPIDVGTGDYADYRTDFAYDSILPLSLERAYAGRATVSGLLGSKWVCSWSQRLLYDHDRGTVTYQDAEGQHLEFQVPGPSFYHRHPWAPHYTLSGSRRHARIFDERSQRTLHFRAASPRAAGARLAAIEDRNGNRVDFIYRDERLAEIVHSDGVRFVATTTPQGWLQALHLAGDGEALVRYAYDGLGRLTDAYSRFFGEFHFSYTEQGWLSSWADSGPTQAMLTYDTQGRVIATRTNEGNLYNDRFEYFPDQRLTRFVNALGEETRIWYNADDRVIRQRNGLGETTVTEWDEYGRKTAETDALGRTVAYQYDDDGRLARQTDWAGRSVAYRYDEYGNLTALTEAAGETRWTYDDHSNVLETALPDGRRLRHQYDQRGRLIATTFPDNSTEHWEYEGTGRLCGHRDALGHATRFRQDLWGRTTAITDAKGHASRYEYAEGPTNPRGALSRLIRPDGSEERFEYDSESCLARQTGAEGQTNRYRHGAYDLLRSVVDPLGYTTRLDYDDAARLSRITNTAGQHWLIRYDAAGRLAQETDWGGRTTDYRRDAAGRVVAKRLPDGSEHRIEWDDRDRVAAVHADRQRIEYGYDERDRLVRAATYVLPDADPPEPDTEIRYEYDDRGLLIREIQNGTPIAYRYDEAGRLIGRSSPSGETAWQFDALGLLQSLDSNGHGFRFHRDALGLERSREHRVQSKTGDAGRSGRFFLQQDYDVCGRLSRQSAGIRLPQPPGFPPALSKPSVVRHFHWDKTGRLAAVDDSIRGWIGYRYDPRDQITAVQREPGRGRLGQESFAYDELMNLIASGPQRLHGYARGCVQQIGNTLYRYDARGRTVAKTVEEKGFRPRHWRYDWDEFDRLAGLVTPEGEHWRYTYDAFGRRVSKTCVAGSKRRNQATVSYLWQGPNLAEEWKVYADGTSEAPARTAVSRWHFEPGSFTPLAKETLSAAANNPLNPDAGSEFWPIVADTVAAPLELYNGEGECIWQAERRLWGRTRPLWRRMRKLREGNGRELSADGDAPVQDCNLRFPGQWEDEESGLHYNLYRYYDPESGQYLSPDPIRLAGGLRTQGYVHDPVGWVDPWGLNGYEKWLSSEEYVEWVAGVAKKEAREGARGLGGAAARSGGHGQWMKDAAKKLHEWANQMEGIKFPEIVEGIRKEAQRLIDRAKGTNHKMM